MVGVVTRTHGVRGGFKVRPETDDPYRFEALETVYLGDALRAHTIREVGFQPLKNGLAVLLELDGVQTREAAEALHGLEVWAAEEDLPPLEDGQVFLSDLVGLQVRSESGEVLGEVVDVVEYPAHPTLSVRRSGGSLSMVPFVEELVPEVDSDAGYLTVVALEGLLDGEPASERD